MHPSGIGGGILESVFLPSSTSSSTSSSSSSEQPVDKYNVTLMERLLRILYSSCQYGKCEVAV